MIWSKQRFQHAFELLPRVLKEVAPLLLPVSILIWGLEFYVAWLNKERFADPYSASMMVIVIAGLLGIILQSFASVIGILYVARSTQRQMRNGAGDHPFQFLKKHFHQTFIEYLRAFISIGLYTLLLIIPGIIRWVQLIFVCLVSSFDPPYLEGKKDALTESRRLVKGALIPLFFLLVLQMILPLTLEDVAKSEGVLGFLSIPFYLAAWVINLYLAIYFSLTFFARHAYKLEKA